MIKFILYATKPALFAQEIKHTISLLLKYNIKSVFLTSLNCLVCLASRLSKGNSAVLLFVCSDEELEGLVNIQKHFGSLPIILVLPDDNTETLQKGMLLHPLYFMAKQAELTQFSLTVNELCNIYKDTYSQRIHHHSLDKKQGALSLK